jgi:MoaA/NifB/PqqE/SkfB family radical SAM enzyme
MIILLKLKHFFDLNKNRLFDIFFNRTPLPPSIAIELNYECPSRCRTCKLWTEEFKKARIGTKVKLTVEQWKGIIGNISKIGIKNVLLGGGEPFAYPGILEVIDFCNKNNISINTFTNGILINDNVAKKIVLSSLNSIWFSLDGPTSDTHDYIRNVKGSFEKIYNAITLINKYKTEFKKVKPHIYINTTITSANIYNIFDMPKLAISMGAEILHFQLYSVVNEELAEKTNKILSEKAITYHSFSNLPKDLQLSKDQIGFLLQKIPQILRINNDKLKCTVDPMLLTTPPNILSKGIFNIKHCNYFWNFSAISPFGDVFPCPMLPEYFLGNVLNESFKKIWNNKKYISLRKKLRKGLFPICYNCCIR